MSATRQVPSRLKLAVKSATHIQAVAPNARIPRSPARDVHSCEESLPIGFNRGQQLYHRLPQTPSTLASTRPFLLEAESQNPFGNGRTDRERIINGVAFGLSVAVGLGAHRGLVSLTDRLEKDRLAADTWDSCMPVGRELDATQQAAGGQATGITAETSPSAGVDEDEPVKHADVPQPATSASIHHFLSVRGARCMFRSLLVPEVVARQHAFGHLSDDGSVVTLTRKVDNSAFKNGLQQQLPEREVNDKRRPLPKQRPPDSRLQAQAPQASSASCSAHGCLGDDDVSCAENSPHQTRNLCTTTTRKLAMQAEHGNSSAALKLGLLLFQGDAKAGVPRDVSKAASLFKAAADGGSIDGLHNYALCVEHGIGVSKDLEAAKSLFALADLLGHRPAGQRLQNLLASECNH